jgi:hypothetical protein
MFFFGKYVLRAGADFSEILYFVDSMTQKRFILEILSNFFQG